ncbi:hypothetical protein GCM10023195_06340 [Actinoallomurus liliacearum]|uniref:Uncharacterized protein n=1 Tax=Actinoallomurus liliacearum TaxID=1080073 RepID=A0ABP8TDX9_9ACTN
MPIAYTFTSFDGRVLIEKWTSVLGSFELLLNSVIGDGVRQIDLHGAWPGGNSAVDVQAGKSY